MKKSLTAVILVLLAGSFVYGSGSADNSTGAPEAQKTYVLKVATWHAPDHPVSLGLTKLKDLAAAKSDGRIQIQLYPSAQLGPEDAYIDGIKKGNVEMGITGTLMGRDVPVINLGELPFLFDGWDHAKKVFFGPIGKEMVAALPEKAGVRLLGWYADGFRVISSNTDLSSYEKLSGMRLRVPNTPVYVNMAKGFGANPITMAFSEVFTAIEQKVVDGQENPAATIRSSRFYEVQKYILDSKHMFSPRLLIINDKLFQSMSPEDQKILQDAVNQAAEYQWQISVEAEQNDMAFMAANGVKIITPDTTYKAKLRESQKGMYEWFFSTYPDAKPYFDKIGTVK
ncbi:MAG: TRAP transporter substrate-binding protein [Clostridia bacterium]|jgi:tripartite ATP-independent transporter DctP family solute receptor